jgi:hypothetical protein
MDGHRFDNLARALQRHTPRRSALGALGGGLVALLTHLGIDDAAARKKKRKHKKKRCAKRGQRPKKKTRKRCCKGLSKDATGRCAKPCDVCQPAGACRYDAVQAAVDEATPGATLSLCAGTFTGTIEIAKNLTLIGTGNGAGPGNTILDGAGAGTVVVIGLGSTVTLQNLRITGGNTSMEGGGISNSGTLALTGCTVSGNRANTIGGGIGNLGTMELINSTVSGNSTDTGFGGGIGNAVATMKLINSTVSGNSAIEGGGIYNFDGTLELIDSSVTANSAGGDGGGIHNDDGTVICSDGSTVSGNTAFDPPVPSNCIDANGGTGCATCLD